MEHKLDYNKTYKRFYESKEPFYPEIVAIIEMFIEDEVNNIWERNKKHFTEYWTKEKVRELYVVDPYSWDGSFPGIESRSIKLKNLTKHLKKVEKKLKREKYSPPKKSDRFNFLRKAIGSAPISSEEIGKFYYYSSYTRTGNNWFDIDLTYIKKEEFQFKLNHYKTTSIKIEILSIHGNKFFDLKSPPEYHNDKIVFKLFDFTTRENISLILSDMFAFFMIEHSKKGWMYYKEQKYIDIRIDIDRKLNQ